MPLIKADQSVPLFKDAIVLNMSDVAVQAQQIRDSAQKTAQQVIAEAKARAQKVSDDHASEGYERGYADGYKKGQAEGLEHGTARGHKEGHALAVAESREQFEPLVASWTEAAKVWEAYHDKLDMDARDSVIELALRLAEKIIHRQLQVDQQMVVDQVTSALKAMTGATNLSIHINPDDRPVMDEVMPELHETFGQFKHMRVVADANVGRGGCILVHDHGRLNATVETQLRRAVELLLPGDLDVEPKPLVPEPVEVSEALSPDSVEAAVVQEVEKNPEIQDELQHGSEQPQPSEDDHLSPESDAA
jgi:flagellar assembly protein FliH